MHDVVRRVKNLYRVDTSGLHDCHFKGGLEKQEEKNENKKF